jgi:hypothetical protein
MTAILHPQPRCRFRGDQDGGSSCRLHPQDDRDPASSTRESRRPLIPCINSWP